MIINKHIVSVQELDNGNYLVEFAGHSPEEEIEEEVEEEVESALHDKEEVDPDEDEEKMSDKEEDDDQEKYVTLGDLLAELKSFNL